MSWGGRKRRLKLCSFHSWPDCAPDLPAPFVPHTPQKTSSRVSREEALITAALPAKPLYFKEVRLWFSIIQPMFQCAFYTPQIWITSVDLSYFRILIYSKISTIPGFLKGVYSSCYDLTLVLNRNRNKQLCFPSDYSFLWRLVILLETAESSWCCWISSYTSLIKAMIMPSALHFVPCSYVVFIFFSFYYLVGFPSVFSLCKTTCVYLNLN